MNTKPARKQSRISTYDAGTYRWCIVSPSIITFLIIFLNLCEPLLSNGSHRFKKFIKKVIIDGETIDHRYVPASYVDILDCFRAGLVPICIFCIWVTSFKLNRPIQVISNQFLVSVSTLHRQITTVT